MIVSVSSALRSRAGLRAAIACGVFITIVTGLAAAFLLESYQSTFADAERRVISQSKIVKAHIEQVLSAVDSSLRSIDGDLESDELRYFGDPSSLHLALRRGLSASPALQAMAFIGPDGFVLANGSELNAARLNLADRPFFIAHRDSRDAGLRIDRPIVSRPSSNISIPVSRRVEGTNGEFVGVIAARLDPIYFETFFSLVDADFVSLAAPDGSVLARHPKVDLISASRLPIPGASDDYRDGIFKSPIDNFVYLMRISKILESNNIYLRVGEKSKSIQMQWMDGAVQLFSFSISLIFMSIFALVLFLMRESAATLRFDNAKYLMGIAKQERDAAVEFNVQKSNFLAHMSHELRTPLNAIIGFSEVISADTFKLGVNAKYRSYAEDINYSSKHLLSIINQILDLAKVDAGKWELNETKFTLRTLMESAARMASQRSERENVEIIIDCPPEEIILYADERTLRQILLNLLINAIRFAGSDRLVRLWAVRHEDGGMEIVVSDRGAGMTEDDAARVLRPFETARSEEARRKSDTGLGLPLSKRFAELHGGTLVIDSAPGKGTSVSVLLPPERVIVDGAAGN